MTTNINQINIIEFRIIFLFWCSDTYNLNFFPAGVIFVNEIVLLVETKLLPQGKAKKNQKTLQNGVLTLETASKS